MSKNGFEPDYSIHARQAKRSVGNSSETSDDVSPSTSRKVSIVDVSPLHRHHHYNNNEYYNSHTNTSSSRKVSEALSPGDKSKFTINSYHKDGPQPSYKGFHQAAKQDPVPPLQHPIKPRNKRSLFGKFINSKKEDRKNSESSLTSDSSNIISSFSKSVSRLPSVSGFREQLGMSSISSTLSLSNQHALKNIDSNGLKIGSLDHLSPYHHQRHEPVERKRGKSLAVPDILSTASSPELYSSLSISNNINSLRNRNEQSVVTISIGDLDDMSGIVNKVDLDKQYDLKSAEFELFESLTTPKSETWAAPESWDVKNHKVKDIFSDDDDDYVIRKNYEVKQFDDESISNKNYHLRIYAEDDNFKTTLKRPYNECVDEMIKFLKKKYQLNGDYKLSLRIGKVTKKLEPNQRPLKIQTNLLLLSGYLETDKLDEIGRFDLSHLFKFILHHDVLKQLLPNEEGYINKDLVHVNLKSKDLQKIPALCYSSKVQSLDVSNNGDISLPLDFFQMPDSQLSGLRMVNIRTKVFPSNIVYAKELVSLDLERNFISFVPENVSMLRNLSILTLSCNKLTSLPELPPSLKILDISSNHFSEFPESVNKLTNLLQLDLSYNRLTQLPESINSLNSIKKINISSNYLTNVSISLQNLRTLNLRHNDISEIHLHDSNIETFYLTNNHISNIADPLPALKTLDLQKNPITQLNMLSHNLASLNLQKAKLTSLPTVILSFTKLEKLELSKNALRELPDISSLTNLKELSIYSNNLEMLPDLSALTKLKVLDVHDNNLKSIHDLSFVESLNISSNLISQLPEPKFNNLIYLRAADNQLDDDCFYTLRNFTKLKLLSLAYNRLIDIPSGTIGKNIELEQLYLSGNSLSTLPDDFDEIKSMKVLCLNGNKFRTLPSDLSSLTNIEVVDVGSNDLKYNTSNSKYEWNWKYNTNIKYLNLSGNKKLEITEDLNLPKLRLLGLMDLTITTQSIPDESLNVRVRTTPSVLSIFSYGISDRINKHITIRDSVFENVDGGILVGLFDGMNSGKISYLIRDNFHKIFEHEISRSDIITALRHTFLQLTGVVSSSKLNSEDGLTGSTVTVLYIKDSKVYTANIGDTMVMLAKPDGSYSFLTVNHQPSSAAEFDRIRTSGGFVSSNDKVDGISQVSRAAGFTDLLPHIHTGPDISEITLQDEVLVIGTKELFEYLPIKTIGDIVRENDNPMLTAERLRDYAISYGCSQSIAAVVLTKKKFKKKYTPAVKQLIEDSNLRRLKPEIQPPTGELAMVFTDIKNSTSLWENYPLAMRSAIRTHNDIMRRQLHIVGGYEVKTEGDAFMVSFPTVTAAMIWCFNVQQQLLQEDWPVEIIQSEECGQFKDTEGFVIYKGLSVRMGIHWGTPVCETDIITRRMDYFGPMVNKAARVCAVADGGEITLTFDCLNEFKRIGNGFHLKNHEGNELNKPIPTKYAINETLYNQFKILHNIEWVCYPMGKVQLKGLETEEEITVIFPKNLATRYRFQKKPDLTSDDTRELKDIVTRLDRVTSIVFGTPINTTSNKKIDYLDKSYFDLFITRIEYIASMLALRDNTKGLKASGGLFDMVEELSTLYQEIHGKSKV